jgi:putative membrane protein
MKQLIYRIERFCYVFYLLLCGLGLTAIAVIFPQPDLTGCLPKISQIALSSGIKYQFIVQIVLAAAVISLYAWRTIGIRQLFLLMITTMTLPFAAEMLSIKTGLPFGYFTYPDGNTTEFIAIGLGSKVFHLVPWTISLWWFSGVASTYLLARSGLEALQLPQWCSKVGAIVLGPVLSTAWNLAFEPAQLRSAIRFWDFQQSGVYFGMPAFNPVSFFAVIVIILTFVNLMSSKQFMSTGLEPDLPFGMYLSYFSLAIIFDVGTSLWVPLGIGFGFGLLPAFPTGMQSQSGASPRASTSSNAAVFCPSNR